MDASNVTPSIMWHKIPHCVYYRRGCLPVAVAELRKLLQKTKVMIISEQDVYARGLANFVESIFFKAGFTTCMYFDFNEATVAKAKVLASKLVAFQPDCIVALGSGITISLAKAAWILAEHQDADLVDLAARFGSVAAISPETLITGFPKMTYEKFVAIPTTSGEGDECSPYILIHDEASNKLLTIADFELMPYMAIADPNLVMELSKELTASSGFEAVMHTLEAAVNLKACEFTSGQCQSAIKLLMKHLPVAYAQGGMAPKDREEVHYAASLAGVCYSNSCLGLWHSIAHAIAFVSKKSCGAAAAAMFTKVIRFNLAAGDNKDLAAERYAALADALSLTSTSASVADKVEALIKAIEKLICDLELCTKLDLTAEQKERIVAMVLEDDAANKHATFIRPVTKEDVAALL